MKILSTSLFSLLFAFLLSTSWAASPHTHEDFLQCLSFHSPSISSTIYTPKNSSYLSILQSSAQNLRPLSTSRPLLIVTPLHESEIQSVIICSKKYGVEVRVRSGGHDFEGLSYTSESPFLILDLRNFRSVTVDIENNTAWIGAGATLGELYYTIAQSSRTLAFSAGVCPTVGVGGQFSGGGYGMMSRRHGLAADHIVDAQLINVNGTILDRDSMGEDLFWAIRGGGGASFGVILAWKIELVSVPRNVTVFNVTRTLEQNVTSLVHKWQYIADKIDDNLLIRLFLRSVNSSSHGGRTIEVSFTSLYLGGVDTLLPIMEQNFPELGLTRQDCSEMSWIQSMLYMAGFPTNESLDVLLDRTPLNRAYLKIKSDYVKEPISENGLQRIWERLYEEVGSADIQFTPYGGRMNEFSESDLPFPHRSGNIFVIEYAVLWNDGEETERHITWMRSLYSLMSRYVSRSPRAAYLNFRDLDIGVNGNGKTTSYARARIWGNKYFKNNFDRLVHVKTMVDPENFFRNEQSIPPLSPRWRKRGD